MRVFWYKRNTHTHWAHSSDALRSVEGSSFVKGLQIGPSNPNATHRCYELNACAFVRPILQLFYKRTNQQTRKQHIAFISCVCFVRPILQIRARAGTKPRFLTKNGHQNRGFRALVAIWILDDYKKIVACDDAMCWVFGDAMFFCNTFARWYKKIVASVWRAKIARFRGPLLQEISEYVWVLKSE